MFLAHKIELRPTPEQEQFLFQSVGARRFTYNALLAHFKQDGVKWNKKAANDKLNDLKSEHAWMQDVSARTSRNVIDDLDNAFKKFFKNVKAGKKPGFPKFKKKGISDSFSIREQQKFDVNGRMLRIEKLKTRIKIRQRLRLNGKAKQCTVSFSGCRWFASILVECAESPWNPIGTNTRKSSVGVDIGIKSLAVLSDGTEIPANQPLKRQLKKLATLQKRFARQKKDSNRRSITKRKIARLHFFITEKRKAVLHGLTDYLTRNYDRIVIEDLNVSGMIKNRKLSRAIRDVGFGEFRRQLEYKSFFRGCELVIADRFFPSSKMCSGCGVIHDMPLGNREMNCDCGTVLDRDHNAAINLMNYVPTRSSGTKSTQEFSKTASAAA
jgi:putative transposase